MSAGDVGDVGAGWGGELLCGRERTGSTRGAVEEVVDVVVGVDSRDVEHLGLGGCRGTVDVRRNHCHGILVSKVE